MTDRAQPGAIDSLIRNDELAQIFGRFSDGFIVPGNDPTPAAQRRSDIDETALNAFSLTTSSSSLDVTVAPGEAFVSGWVCRDVSTTLTLPANSTVDIVVGFNPDAIFDPNVDADRDAADETVVDIAANVDATTPTTVAHRVTTDGSGVVSSERIAAVGSQLSVDNLIVDTVSLITDATPRPGGLKVAQKTNPRGTEIFEFTNASFAIRSSPTVVDGVVYVGSFDNSLYAIDADTGDQVFEFTNATEDIRSSPAVADGVVYVGSDDNSLYAIDADTGGQVFEFTNANASIGSSPAVADGVVYVGSLDSSLYAIDADTGNQIFEFTNANAAIQSSPAVADGVVYVGSGDESLYAIDAATGSEIFEFTKPGGSVRSSPAVVDGVVYVGSFDTSLYAIDAATGNEIFEFTNASFAMRSSPVVVDGVVYVGNNDNSLYAIDAATGNEIFEFTKPGGSVRSSPAVVDGVVYVGSFDTSLYAIDAVEREAQLYVGDEFGFIPLHKGPGEEPRINGSTLTGNVTAERDFK